MYMNGYGNYNPNGGYYGGYMYQAPQKVNMTQGLTKDQLASLRKTGGFNLDISQEELWRSFCTHRDDGRIKTTAPDEEGYITCSLCGTKFKPFEGDTNAARDLVGKVVDLLETTKTQALTLPPQVIQDFFQIEPVLKRLPDLYSISRSDWNKIGGGNDYIYGQENSAFNMYQNMVNPLAGNGYYDPAMMNQPIYGAQPQMMNQPMMQQPMQYGQPQMMNQPMMQQPMQYGQPMNMPPQANMQYNQAPQGGNPFSSNQAPIQQNQQQSQNNQQQPETVTVTKTLTD